MDEPHHIWRDQCVAALSIQKQFGTEKALGYLVGVAPRDAPARNAVVAGQPPFKALRRQLMEEAISLAKSQEELEELLGSKPRLLGKVCHPVCKSLWAMEQSTNGDVVFSSSFRRLFTDE